MKLSMEITMDGLVATLRGLMHRLAEEAESATAHPPPPRADAATARAGEKADGLSRR